MEVTRPSSEEAASLAARLPELHRRAAQAISAADALFIVCGAGWSVPSGLKTYADVAGDYSDGTTYRDLCDPGLLIRRGKEPSASGDAHKKRRLHDDNSV